MNNIINIAALIAGHIDTPAIHKFDDVLDDIIADFKTAHQIGIPFTLQVRSFADDLTAAAKDIIDFGLKDDFVKTFRPNQTSATALAVLTTLSDLKAADRDIIIKHFIPAVDDDDNLNIDDRIALSFPLDHFS